MDGWNDLFKEVVHELKTPIASVMGYLDLIENTGPLNDQQQLFKNRARQRLELMSEQVSFLLDLAWIDANVPLVLESTDLKSLIIHAVDMLDVQVSKRNLTVHVDVMPRLGKIQAETRRLEQVMTNLLSNAIKYNREGGEIWISARGNKQEVRVTVRDSGQGIALNEQGRIFERFFRSSASRKARIEGSGLGLSIVKAMVEKHGGRIWFESVEGEGTSFIFVLPRKPQIQADGVLETQVDAAFETTHDTHEAPREINYHAEGADYVVTPGTGEQNDAVDDSIQEAPNAILVDAADSDRNDYGAIQG